MCVERDGQKHVRVGEHTALPTCRHNVDEKQNRHRLSIGDSGHPKLLRDAGGNTKLAAVWRQQQQPRWWALASVSHKQIWLDEKPWRWGKDSHYTLDASCASSRMEKGDIRQERTTTINPTTRPHNMPCDDYSQRNMWGWVVENTLRLVITTGMKTKRKAGFLLEETTDKTDGRTDERTDEGTDELQGRL